VDTNDGTLLLNAALGLTEEMFKKYKEETSDNTKLWLRTRPGLHLVKMEIELSWFQVVASAVELWGLKRILGHESHNPKYAPNTLTNFPPDVATLGMSFDEDTVMGVETSSVELVGNWASALDSIEIVTNLCCKTTLTE
jgi:hypothetical protein